MVFKTPDILIRRDMECWGVKVEAWPGSGEHLRAGGQGQEGEQG